MARLRARALRACARRSALEEQHPNVVCEVTPHTLVVQSGGFTFVGIIHHEPSNKLLVAAGRAKEASSLRALTSDAAAHMGAIGTVSRLHPAYSPATRLVKRWISCQMLSADINDRLVEWLVAAPFLLPNYHTPGKHQTLNSEEKRERVAKQAGEE